MLLPTYPCWRQPPVHMDQAEDAGVLLNSVNYVVSVPLHIISVPLHSLTFSGLKTVSNATAIL